MFSISYEESFNPVNNVADPVDERHGPVNAFLSAFELIHERHIKNRPLPLLLPASCFLQTFRIWISLPVPAWWGWEP